MESGGRSWARGGLGWAIWIDCLPCRPSADMGTFNAWDNGQVCRCCPRIGPFARSVRLWCGKLSDRGSLGFYSMLQYWVPQLTNLQTRMCLFLVDGQLAPGAGYVHWFSHLAHAVRFGGCLRRSVLLLACLTRLFLDIWIDVHGFRLVSDTLYIIMLTRYHSGFYYFL